MTMDGKEVFRRAVRVMVDVGHARRWTPPGSPPTTSTLRGPPPGQHPHHRRRLLAARDPAPTGWPRVLHATGNTSSASIPLALVDALDGGRVAAGDHVLLVGIRRRHELGQRRAALDRAARTRWHVSVPRRGRARHRRQPGHRPGLRPGLRRRAATGSPSPTAASRPRPTMAAGLAVRAVRRHRRRPGRRRLRRASRTSSGPSRCWSPTPASTADMLVLRMGDDDFTSRARRQPGRRASASPSAPCRR